MARQNSISHENNCERNNYSSPEQPTPIQRRRLPEVHLTLPEARDIQTWIAEEVAKSKQKSTSANFLDNERRVLTGSLKMIPPRKRGSSTTRPPTPKLLIHAVAPVAAAKSHDPRVPLARGRRCIINDNPHPRPSTWLRGRLSQVQVRETA